MINTDNKMHKLNLDDIEHVSGGSEATYSSMNDDDEVLVWNVVDTLTGKVIKTYTD